MAAVLLAVTATVSLSRLEVFCVTVMILGVALGTVNPSAAGVAAHGPAVVIGWLFAFVVGRRFSQAEYLPRLLGRIWAVAGTLMAFGGLAALSYLPAHHSGRLAAFLGYPIAVGMLGLLGLCGSLAWLADGRRAPALLAFGNALAIWLSGSRGVWAVCIAVALYFAWAAPQLLRRAWLPVAAALVGALWLGPAVAARDWGAAGFAKGWAWFLGRAAAMPLTEGSSVERLTFLKDGLSMALRHPLGAGYRAWTALHLQGASYGYYSAEAHSALVDHALAFGWLGLAAFLLLLARFLWALREGRGWSPWRLAALAGLGALGVHSLVDWDLSYAIFAVPLWLGFGLVPPKTARLTLPRWSTQVVAGLALTAAVYLGTSDLFVFAAQNALGAGDPGSALLHASLAAELAPWSDTAHAALGQAESGLGHAGPALAAFAKARQLGPYEPWYAALHARELTSAGQWRDAADAWVAYTRLWPWEVNVYETALDALVDSAMQAALHGDRERSAYAAAAGREILFAFDRQKAREPVGRPRRPMQVNTPAIGRARAYFSAGPGA